MFLMDTVFGHEQSIGMFNIELILIKKEKKTMILKGIFCWVFVLELSFNGSQNSTSGSYVCDDNLKNQSCMISKLTLCV